MTRHPEGPCEYLRTGVALALWLHRGDLDAARQLTEDCDNVPHLAHDLASLSHGLLELVSGAGGILVIPDMAVTAAANDDGSGWEVARAYLTNALLACPAMAWELPRELAGFAARGLGAVVHNAIRAIARPDSGRTLLEQLAQAGTAEEMADLVARVHGG